jgi:hypothetical protein
LEGVNTSFESAPAAGQQIDPAAASSMKFYAELCANPAA